MSASFALNAMVIGGMPTFSSASCLMVTIPVAASTFLTSASVSALFEVIFLADSFADMLMPAMSSPANAGPATTATKAATATIIFFIEFLQFEQRALACRKVLHEETAPGASRDGAATVARPRE